MWFFFFDFAIITYPIMKEKYFKGGIIMRDVNKGLFGLYNYKGSILEITAKDSLP